MAMHSENILSVCVGVLLSLLIFAPSYSSCSGTSMQVGDVLTTGNSLIIGGCTLTMQADCNLVLDVEGRTFWSTNTYDKGDGHCQLKLNNNGELIIFSGAGNVIWTSSFQGQDGNYVVEFNGDCDIGIINLNNGQTEWSSCPSTWCHH